jgi:Flp pilus assembly protein TadG
MVAYPQFGKDPGEATANPATQVGFVFCLRLNLWFDGKVAGLKKARNRSNGQAMVEFALVLPVLLLIIFGIIEASRLVFMYSSVINASREAARFGSASGFDSAGTLNYQNCAGIRNAARQVAFLYVLQDSDITIQYDTGPGSTVFHTCTGSIDTGVSVVAGDRVLVTITTAFNPIVPLVGLTPKTLSSSSARTIIGIVSLGAP